jgi:hypothetical protein
MRSALPPLRQHHPDQLLAVLPRGEIQALEKFLERHPFPTFLHIVNDSQENHVIAHGRLPALRASLLGQILMISHRARLRVGAAKYNPLPFHAAFHPRKPPHQLP